jgi:hypothetical protein
MSVRAWGERSRPAHAKKAHTGGSDQRTDAGGTDAKDADSEETDAGDKNLKPRWRWSHHAELLLISFSALLIEISYTRIISFKLFYYYVYLVIGVALLGIGSGGVLVAISKRLRHAATDTVLFWALLLGAIGTLGGYYVIAYCQLDSLAIWEYGTSASNKAFALLLVMCLCIFVTFLAAGIFVATLFGRHPQAIGGLYFADLLGAGAACAVVIYLISSLGAPATVMVAVVVMAATAVWAARRMGRILMAVAMVVTIGGGVLAVRPGLLPYQRLDTSKYFAKGKVQYSEWGPILRVDAQRVPNLPVVLLFHDGILGAGIYEWNGKHSGLDMYHFPQSLLSIPFRVLGGAPQHEAVIGAAGGHEVLASLFYGAGHVDAVELNPVTVHLVSTTYANFDGHLAQNPRVTYTVADGRSYIARTKQHYQLIWYPAPDSYAATSGALSSAYVLSESYLYTTNGVQADLQHLTSGGIFVAQFGEVNDIYDLRTTRFVATARQALANMGITDASNHILVATTQIHFIGTEPESTIVVSVKPFSQAELAGFNLGLTSVPQTKTLYAPGQIAAVNPVQTYMDTPNSSLAHFYSTFAFNVTPTTDNDPFFYHFARYGTVIENFFHSISSVDREDAVGERVLLLLLALSIVLAGLFLLLPFVAIRKEWRKLPRKKVSAVFFAGVGFGFIFFEITLMQVLNLFLGYPTYALTVVLMSLLVFTGVGALISRRVTRPRRVIPSLLAGIAALTAFYLFGLGPMTTAMLGLPLAVRIITAFVILGPLGVCFGMFMPIGLGEIAAQSGAPREYVAWGWAVNGFASVVGSASATIMSMIFGFKVVLFLGFVAYAVAVAAWMLLSRGRRAIPAPAGAVEPAEPAELAESPEPAIVGA